MRDVVITCAVRTPVGAFGKALKSYSAIDLGAHVIKSALKMSNISGSDVDDVVFGCVLQSGLGQNISRQCSIGAGLPVETPAVTINQACGSGMRSVILAAQMIRAGDAEIVIAGGTESMSQASYSLQNLRFGSELNGVNTTDEILLNYTDPFFGYHMGMTAENLAEQFKITRAEQDRFTFWSQTKARVARDAERLSAEICPIQTPGNAVTDGLAVDEGIVDQPDMELLRLGQPAFKVDGSVTTENSSGISDGAAALVLMSREKAREMESSILGELTGYAQIGVDPSLAGYGSVSSIKKMMHTSTFAFDEIDLFELNETYAAQTLAVIKGLKEEGLGDIPGDRLNVNGGALALGSPMGASGPRILVTLLHEMQKRDSRSGLASMCAGGGLGSSVLVSRAGPTAHYA